MGGIGRRDQMILGWSQKGSAPLTCSHVRSFYANRTPAVLTLSDNNADRLALLH